MLEFPACLHADLSRLTDALDGPTTLETQVWALGETVRDAVPAFIGLTLTRVVDHRPVSVTAFDPGAGPADVTSSVLLPLTDQAGTHVVLYADRPGAWTQLAAGYHRDGVPRGGRAVLDRHLHPRPGNGVAGLTELARTNQAIGVLIARGHTPDGARAELAAAAARPGSSPDAAADAVLASLTHPPGPGEPAS